MPSPLRAVGYVRQSRESLAAASPEAQRRAIEQYAESQGWRLVESFSDIGRSGFDPKGVELPVADTSAALGLGPREGQQSPLIRSLVRLQQFDLACSDGEATVAVRRTLPSVHRRHVRRLPSGLQAQHAQWVEEQATKPVDVARRRARRFALTLLAQDEPIDAVERALHAGGFHPALAHEAVRWAREQATTLNETP